MNLVGSFEIRILIVLPMCEDEAADSQSMGRAFFGVYLVMRLGL